MALIVTAGGGFYLFFRGVGGGAGVGGWRCVTRARAPRAATAAPALPRAPPWSAPALILILLGALTKSAQFPFHFWLPHAMAAPTPVSAYLHSATMVKAGVFLLARPWPTVSSTEAW